MCYVSPYVRVPEPLDSLVIWTDANLSSPKTTRLLSGAGLTVITHAETYPRVKAPIDEVWIEMTGQKGWVAFTGDTRVAYNPTEKATIERYKARVFCVTNAYATAEEKAAWFLNNLEEIAKACLEPPPGCWQVRRSGIRRVLPSGGGRSRPQPQWMLPIRWDSVE